MARRIYLGVVEKRLNSTLRPDLSDMSEFSCIFKEGFDYKHPVIILSYDGLLEWYNYMYIPEIYTYFWITGERCIQYGRYELTGYVDVLATYRAAIKGTTAFIEYGFNSNSSGATYRVRDTRQNVSNVPAISTASVDITGGKVNALSKGCYVLQAVGASNGVRTFVLSESQMPALINSVNKDITSAVSGMTSTEEILQYLTAGTLTQGSAMSAIKNCFFLPCNVGDVAIGSAELFLGDYDTGIRAATAQVTPIVVHTSINIPWQGAEWQRLNTQGLLYLPFCGTVGLPVDKINGASAINITWSLSAIDGGVSVKVDANNYTIYTGSGTLAVPFAIGSSAVPIGNTISGTATAIGGAIEAGGGVLSMATGNISGGLTQAGRGATQAVQGTIQALSPVVQCTGTLAGNANLGLPTTAILEMLYYAPLDNASFQSVYGYPVMRVGRPVNGYCKTRGFSVNNSHATADECAEINAYMDSGVFIE